MLSAPAYSGPSVRYHCATGERSRRPVSTHVAPPNTTPAARASSSEEDRMRRVGEPKVSGSFCSTSMMTMMVRASTSSWVSPTSGAPSAMICTVARMPTADSETVAARRDRAATTITTDAVISSSRTASMGWERPGVTGGMDGITARRPAPITRVNVVMIAAAWRVA